MAMRYSATIVLVCSAGFLWAEIWRSRRCGLSSDSTIIENIEYRYIEARQRLECDYNI